MQLYIQTTNNGLISSYPGSPAQPYDYYIVYDSVNGNFKKVQSGSYDPATAAKDTKLCLYNEFNQQIFTGGYMCTYATYCTNTYQGYAAVTNNGDWACSSCSATYNNPLNAYTSISYRLPKTLLLGAQINIYWYANWSESNSLDVHVCLADRADWWNAGQATTVDIGLNHVAWDSVNRQWTDGFGPISENSRTMVQADLDAIVGDTAYVNIETNVFKPAGAYEDHIYCNSYVYDIALYWPNYYRNWQYLYFRGWPRTTSGNQYWI